MCAIFSGRTLRIPSFWSGYYVSEIRARSLTEPRRPRSDLSHFIVRTVQAIALYPAAPSNGTTAYRL